MFMLSSGKCTNAMNKMEIRGFSLYYSVRFSFSSSFHGFACVWGASVFSMPQSHLSPVERSFAVEMNILHLSNVCIAQIRKLEEMQMIITIVDGKGVVQKPRVHECVFIFHRCVVADIRMEDSTSKGKTQCDNKWRFFTALTATEWTVWCELRRERSTGNYFWRCRPNSSERNTFYFMAGAGVVSIDFTCRLHYDIHDRASQTQMHIAQNRWPDHNGWWCAIASNIWAAKKYSRSSSARQSLSRIFSAFGSLLDRTPTH